jgi:surface protein
MWTWTTTTTTLIIPKDVVFEFRTSGTGKWWMNEWHYTIINRGTLKIDWGTTGRMDSGSIINDGGVFEALDHQYWCLGNLTNKNGGDIFSSFKFVTYTTTGLIINDRTSTITGYVDVGDWTRFVNYGTIIRTPPPNEALINKFSEGYIRQHNDLRKTYYHNWITDSNETPGTDTNDSNTAVLEYFGFTDSNVSGFEGTRSGRSTGGGTPIILSGPDFYGSSSSALHFENEKDGFGRYRVHSHGVSKYGHPEHWPNNPYADDPAESNGNRPNKEAWRPTLSTLQLQTTEAKRSIENYNQMISGNSDSNWISGATYLIKLGPTYDINTDGQIGHSDLSNTIIYEHYILGPKEDTDDTRYEKFDYDTNNDVYNGVYNTTDSNAVMYNGLTWNRDSTKVWSSNMSNDTNTFLTWGDTNQKKPGTLVIDASAKDTNYEDILITLDDEIYAVRKVKITGIGWDHDHRPVKKLNYFSIDKPFYKLKLESTNDESALIYSIKYRETVVEPPTTTTTTTAPPTPITTDNINNAVDAWITDSSAAETTYGHISNWDVSQVKNMSHLFENKVFNEDLSAWDVSNVTNMSYMFKGWKPLPTTTYLLDGIPYKDSSLTTTRTDLVSGDTNLWGFYFSKDDFKTYGDVTMDANNAIQIHPNLQTVKHKNQHIGTYPWLASASSYNATGGNVSGSYYEYTFSNPIHITDVKINISGGAPPGRGSYKLTVHGVVNLGSNTPQPNPTFKYEDGMTVTFDVDQSVTSFKLEPEPAGTSGNPHVNWISITE